MIIDFDCIEMQRKIRNDFIEEAENDQPHA